MRRLAAIATASLALLLAGCVLTPPQAPAPDPATGSGYPANMASHGVVQTGAGTIATTPEATATPVPTEVGDTVHVVVYVDFLCPFCGQFEAANGEYLQQRVAAGEVVLETHPISFLDRLSLGTEYSTRAANLVAAVASLHPDAVVAVMEQLWLQQPAESTEGLTDDELLAIAAAAGAESDALTQAVISGAFEPFVIAATEAAMAGPVPGQTGGITGTPTAIVDGEQFRGQPNDAAAFAALVDAAIAG